MQRKKHKRKTNHVLIVTSDAVDANVKQYRIRPWILETVIIILCVVIGAMIGYLAYEEKIWEAAVQKNNVQTEAMETLSREKEDLEAEIQSLNNKIQILSETVNQKVESEKELTEQLEKQSTPTEFPLTGSASMEEGMAEETPICIFTASQGTTVVATASGTVIAVNDDAEYGHNVWVDHGNGYVTIYRNQGDPSVKQGESVAQGPTLFLSGESNTRLGYQIMKDELYINPMDMLAISG